MKEKKKKKKIEKKYLSFIKKQEITGEPFHDKIEQLENFYLPIANLIQKKYKANALNNIVGLSGGQGSGKSTISKILSIILREKYNLSTVNISIDDYYKTLEERKKMAKVNKLFLTRGVPGTHDLRLLRSHITLLKKKKFKKFYIPKFDKSIDDRLPKQKWQKINAKPNIIIFEGWCVGAKPETNNDLKKSINILEKKFDKDYSWRKTINHNLKSSYKKIFNKINFLIFLKVPSFYHVYKWRLLQEKKLQFRSKGKKIMKKKDIKKFIMFYERITKSMMKKLVKSANVVITLDNRHKLKSFKIKR